ncbi:hypothetical protein AC578_3894 [Pseudocercospora eumusae]|uniref:Transposase IS30-like HTH domain-containing protein n=1 Tax=Pseudocercospora eumusae TaxID=321146 RepID=A0A139GX42_9PEZI|nr:hypothetical protein AC578_3894 [Pseudocercospora eumusae]
MPRVRPLKSLPRQRVLLSPARTRPPLPCPSRSHAGRRPQFTEQERKYVLQQKTVGKPYQAIADEMRYGVTPISRLRKDESEDLGRPSYVLNANDELIVARFKEGRSLNSIARDFNRPFGIIWFHFHRYLVPSDPELRAKIATDPEIDSIVKRGLLLGKTAQQMARESRQSVHVIKRHVWRYETPTQRRRSKATAQQRQQILKMKEAGKSVTEISLATGLTPRMIHSIVHEEFSKQEVPAKVHRLVADGKDAMEIARKTDVSPDLVRHFIRRLSKGGATPKHKGGPTRWTSPQREKLVALWNAGLKPKAIASELEKTLSGVYLALWTCKDELTRPYYLRSRKRWTEDEINKVLSLQKSQMSLQTIATLMPGRTINGIRFLLRKYRE